MMRRSLGLAIRGSGRVEPNPMVACVIVKEGRVIGEGFHERFGGQHAEAIALARCVESPAGATVYVTLEPCCHTNKKTPPCVPALIEANVARVVVGCADPKPEVAGRGIAQLRGAGVDVTVPALEPESRQLNAAFYKRVRLGLPYVTLKWAESSDGKVAGPPGRRLWISNRRALHIVHELRALCDAILVGMNTVKADDPLLTVRGVVPCRPLHRVVLNRDLTLSMASRVVQSAREAPLIVICADAARREKPDHVRALESRGVEVVPMDTDGSGYIDLPDVLRLLGSRSFTHLLVEPGPTLARSFLRQNLADRAWIFRSPNPVGDPTVPSALRIDYTPTGEAELNGDRLTEYLNPASPAFFSGEPSADLLLVRGFSARAS